MAIKLKEQPLLSHPGDRNLYSEWRMFAEKDVGYITNSLQKDRDDKNLGGAVAAKLLYLQKLGKAQEVGETDKKNLLKGLEIIQTMASASNEAGLVEMYFFLGELGLVQEILAEYMKVIDGYLNVKEDREQYGIIAQVGGLLSKFSQQKVGAENEKRYLASLKKERKKGDGYDIAGLLFNLQRLGMPQKLTEDDFDKMMDKMRFFRKNDDPFRVAEMHLMLDGILEPTQARTKQSPLPPFKKFKK